MKKIINGKRYDTDTAKEIGRDWYSNPRDFSHWVEVLYRKNTGEYFLHGAGGPMSRYAQTVGQNEWSGGERISPLTVEKAKEWAEKHLSADEYEKIFEVEEDSQDRKTVSLSLPLDVIEMIKTGAAEEGKSMSDYVAEAVRDLRNIK